MIWLGVVVDESWKPLNLTKKTHLNVVPDFGTPGPAPLTLAQIEAMIIDEPPSHIIAAPATDRPALRRPPLRSMSRFSL